MRLISLVGVAAFFVTGCFDPKVPSGGVACGPAGLCPQGLVCRAVQGFAGDLCCEPGDATCGGRLAEVSSLDGGVGIDGSSSRGGCNLLGASSCPTGRSCHPYCLGNMTPNNVCEPAGIAKVSEGCKSSSDCAAGLACYFATCGSGQLGVCQAACSNDMDCGAESRCTPISACGQAETHRICTIRCDPRPGAPQTCPAGMSCGLLPSEATDCYCPSGTVVDGGRCDDTNRCKAGFVCMTDQGNRVCRPLCRLDDPSSCGAGRGCAPVPGLSKYGGCSMAAAPPVTARDCDGTLVGVCGAGRACRPTCTGPGVGRATCIPNPGTKQASEACTEETDCAPGLNCIFFSCRDNTTVGFCERICKTNADCGSASSCRATRCDGESSPFRVCGRSCDPMGATSGCPAGLICALYGGDETGCSCRAGSTPVPEGGDCTPTSDCLPGQICVQRGATSKCRPICRATANDCAADRTCVSLPGHRTYGACVPTAGDTPDLCDPTAPASCGAAQKCEIACGSDGRASLTCVAAGTGAVGQSCKVDRDCAAGVGCVLMNCADGTSVGVCVKSCKTNADCGGGSAYCSRQLQCGTTPILYGVCTFGCDPRGATTGCPTGTSCTLFPGEVTNCFCRPASQGRADGEACTLVTDCQPGLGCVLEDARKICRPWCRLDTPNTCPAGRTCTPLTDQRIYGSCSP